MSFLKKIFPKKTNIKIIEDGNLPKEASNSLSDTADWFDDDFEDGQLSLDVYETPKEIMVKSTIAGVKPEDLDIAINEDMLTIRGQRQAEESIKEEDYLYRECYWGSFSRSIILPAEVKADKIKAELENGVLTISLPKAKVAREMSIKVKER